MHEWAEYMYVGSTMYNGECVVHSSMCIARSEKEAIKEALRDIQEKYPTGVQCKVKEVQKWRT